MTDGLDGSIFGPVEAANYDTGAVTFMFSEDANTAGLKMDAAASAEHFAELVGTAIYDMGKGVVGCATAVESDLRTRKIYVEVSVTDAGALAKLRHGVFRGVQARSNAVAKSGTAYTAVPGSLNLVDAPFDRSSALHKAAALPKAYGDAVAALERAMRQAERVLGKRFSPSAHRPSGDPLERFEAAMRGAEVAVAKVDAQQAGAELSAAAARTDAEERLAKMGLRAGGVVIQRRPGGVTLPALEPVTTYAGLRWADEPKRS